MDSFILELSCMISFTLTDIEVAMLSRSPDIAPACHTLGGNPEPRVVALWERYIKLL